MHIQTSIVCCMVQLQRTPSAHKTITQPPKRRQKKREIPYPSHNTNQLAKIRISTRTVKPRHGSEVVRAELTAHCQQRLNGACHICEMIVVQNGAQRGGVAIAAHSACLRARLCHLRHRTEGQHVQAPRNVTVVHLSGERDSLCAGCVHNRGRRQHSLPKLRVPQTKPPHSTQKRHTRD